MKKLIFLFAVMLGTLSTAHALPQALSKEEKAALAAARTESMASSLGLEGKQVKKVGCLNKRFADVLGEEKVPIRPIYGDRTGPYYDTPGRPHPSGRNGVPGSWSRNSDGSADVFGISVGPAMDKTASSSAPENEKAVAKALKRRAKYEKKLSRILTSEQFGIWQSRQLPFNGR